MSPTPAVAKYTTDLTQLGRNGSLRENLNLEKETLRVLEVLGKGGSRQPVILDEKSENQEAVAEQVAIRVAAGNVPRSLTGKKLLKLDVSSLYANSTSDAEVAAKMNEVATAAASSNGAIILFIDEAARFVGPARDGACSRQPCSSESSRSSAEAQRPSSMKWFPIRPNWPLSLKTINVGDTMIQLWEKVTNLEAEKRTRSPGRQHRPRHSRDAGTGPVRQ